MGQVIQLRTAKATAAPSDPAAYTAAYLLRPCRTLDSALGAYIAATRPNEPDRVALADRIGHGFKCNPFAVQVAAWEAMNPGRSIFASN